MTIYKHYDFDVDLLFPGSPLGQQCRMLANQILVVIEQQTDQPERDELYAMTKPIVRAAFAFDRADTAGGLALLTGITAPAPALTDWQHAIDDLVQQVKDAEHEAEDRDYADQMLDQAALRAEL